MTTEDDLRVKLAELKDELDHDRNFSRRKIESLEKDCEEFKKQFEDMRAWLIRAATVVNVAEWIPDKSDDDFANPFLWELLCCKIEMKMMRETG